jgi:hypothetical protein
MKRCGLVLVSIFGCLVARSPALAQCPTGVVQSGPACVDRFEASLWKVTV